MITVVNKRTHVPTPEDILISRGTALGNPFTHIPTGTKALYVVATRDIAVERYRSWLKQKIEDRDANVLRALRSILSRYKAGNNINLVCYCSPLKCHGEIIKDLIENYESLITA